MLFHTFSTPKSCCVHFLNDQFQSLSGSLAPARPCGPGAEFHSVPVSFQAPPLTRERTCSGNENHSVQIKLSPVLKMSRELHLDLITRDKTCRDKFEPRNDRDVTWLNHYCRTRLYIKHVHSKDDYMQEFYSRHIS